MQEVAISDAMLAAKAFLSDTAERREYINREMARMDYESGIEDAIEEYEVSKVVSMLKRGKSPEFIADALEITVEKVNRIAKENPINQFYDKEEF